MTDMDAFDGVWRMADDSLQRDPATGAWAPEAIEKQVVERRTTGDTMVFNCRIDHADDLSLFMRYVCRYDDPEWAPYTLIHIEGDPRHPLLDPNRPNIARKTWPVIGEPIGLVKQIWVDRHTKYRITKHPDGAAQYLLESRLSDDEQHLYGTVLFAGGRDTAIVKHMVRSDETVEWPV